MSINESQSIRRALVVLNYICMFAVITLIYIGELYGDPIILQVGIWVMVAITVSSFVLLHARTRLWWMTHTKIENLDERQSAVTHESLRYSYGIFTVLSLALLLIIALAAQEYDPNLIALFAGLMYLAHTLPGAIIAWTQREV